MNRPLRFAFGSIAALVLLVACNGPTLPLPPPAALVSAPDATGYVSVDGDGLPMAYVFCLDVDTDSGVIGRADASGHFHLRIAATAGATLSVWQQRDNDIGPPRDFIVPGAAPTDAGASGADAGTDAGP